MRRRHLSLGLIGTVLASSALLVPAQTASAAGPRPDFRAPWPCGQGRDYYHHSSEAHNALDFNIAGSADLGTPALASAPGTVIDVVPMPNTSGYGNYVRVDHGGGWTSLVAHLDRITVSKGQYVRTGDELGKVGTTGESSGPHLHYEQEADGQNVPIVIDGVALRYSTTAARHTSGNCGTPQPIMAGSPRTSRVTGWTTSSRSPRTRRQMCMWLRPRVMGSAGRRCGTTSSRRVVRPR